MFGIGWGTKKGETTLPGHEEAASPHGYWTLFRRYVLHTHEVRRGQKQKNAAIHANGGTLAKAPAGPLRVREFQGARSGPGCQGRGIRIRAPGSASAPPGAFHLVPRIGRCSRSTATGPQHPARPFCHDIPHTITYKYFYLLKDSLSLKMLKLLQQYFESSFPRLGK